MYTNQEIVTLDKLGFPMEYAVKGMNFKTGKEILELRKKYKGHNRNFRSKVEKEDRIQFYALQVENGERLEFQENEMKLLPRQLQFVELYERITDREL